MLRVPLIVIAFAIAGLVLGSFVDLSLSEKLSLDRSSLHTLAAYATPLLGLFVIALSAVLLFLYYFHSKNKSRRNASFLAFLIIPLGGAFYGIGVLSSSFSMPIAILVGTLLCALLALLAYFLLRKQDPHAFAKVGFIYLLSAIFVFASSFLLRTIIVRPTYNMLILTDEAGTDYMSFYKAWYLFNTDKTGIPTTVEASYYASFPSLSSALASLGMLLPLACQLHKRLAKDGDVFFWLALLLLVVDGALGIVRGVAFLSDFSFALLLGSVPLFFGVAISKENTEVTLALAANKSKNDQKLRQSFRSPLVYGAGARRAYEEQIPPEARKKIRFRNNRLKSPKEKTKIFIKIDKYRQ